MEIFFVWIILTVVIGILAARFNRSVIGWILLSIVLSPFLAGLILLVLGRKTDGAYEQLPTAKTHVKCPDCAEPIRKDARVCKHCGCRLVPTES